VGDFSNGVCVRSGGVIPTGYESERVAGFDLDAKHDDRDRRPAITDPGGAAGFFGRRMGRSSGLPPRSSWSGLGACLGIPAASAWPRSRSRTCSAASSIPVLKEPESAKFEAGRAADQEQQGRRIKRAAPTTDVSAYATATFPLDGYHFCFCCNWPDARIESGQRSKL
jgi:hypothetical protein